MARWGPPPDARSSVAEIFGLSSNAAEWEDACAQQPGDCPLVARFNKPSCKAWMHSSKDISLDFGVATTNQPLRSDMKRLLMVVCCVLLPVACAADSVEPSGTNTSRSALSAPTLTPVPCGTVDGKKAYTWNGTRGELLVADAFAGCTDTAHDVAMDMTDFPLAGTRRCAT